MGCKFVSRTNFRFGHSSAIDDLFKNNLCKKADLGKHS